MLSLRILVFFYLLPTLISCDRGGREVHVQSHAKVVLIDSASASVIDEMLPYYSTKNAYYPVYYIGEPSDTIILSHLPVSMSYDKERDAKYDTAQNWATITSKNMSIFVDTSVSNDLKSYFTRYGTEHEEIVDSVYYSTFPVVITNLSDSLLRVGAHNIVYWMTREVKNVNGQWVESQKLINGWCGANSRDIIIDAGNILVAKLLRYKGSFKRKCRLKYKFGAQIVYSNEFED